MVRQLHDDMMAHVTDNSTIYEDFVVTNGVKQGCVLPTTIFSHMLFAMLMDAYRDERPGIRIAYRIDRHLLKSWGMQVRMRLSTTTVHNVPFADDCSPNTSTEVDMQQSMDLFASSCAHFELTTNTNQTVSMHQPSPNAEHNSPRITVNSKGLKTVDSFAYLGSRLSRSTRINNVVFRRLSKTSQAFDRPQTSV
nr:unnamed protein product [Spirometra erinaceieuropaei]